LHTVTLLFLGVGVVRSFFLASLGFSILVVILPTNRYY
jgi:hypothetical protein